MKSEQKRLLNTSQAAQILNVASQTLANWRFQGVGPSYVKISSRCLYEREAIEDFIVSKRVKIEKHKTGDLLREIRRANSRMENLQNEAKELVTQLSVEARKELPEDFWEIIGDKYKP